MLTLPPYSPELNPVEHLWDDLREKSFHNRVFDSLDSLERHLSDSLRNLELDPSTGTLHRRMAVDYFFTNELEME
ncbi:transposase [Paraburkholderia hospita]|uniref:transposase n=1 Tax=Paraburkholderia hospita TaxID=169430 RepID=UPI001374D83E